MNESKRRTSKAVVEMCTRYAPGHAPLYAAEPRKIRDRCVPGARRVRAGYTMCPCASPLEREARGYSHKSAAERCSEIGHRPRRVIA